MLNEQEIRKWWDILKDHEHPVEIRVFKDNSTYSGYFTDVESVIEQLRPYDGGSIYATLNPCKEGCMSRVQGDKLMKIGKNPTTSGNDIEGRDYILIDIDPERASGTNATNEEKKHAYLVMQQVGIYLRNMGFQSPVVADSANGYHLYYKVALQNSPEMGELVSKFLKVLDLYFSNEHAKVDTAVADPNRIAKVIGTASAKGRNTASRPQRISRIVKVPDELKTTDISFIRKVAAELPEPPKADRYNNYRTEQFDVDGFISQHGISVIKRTSFKDGEKIVLKECPFDSNHQQAAIFKFTNGAIGFKCFHNSCSSYTWKDVRLHYDPHSYERKDYDAFVSSHKFDRKKEPPLVLPATEEKGEKWVSAVDIKWVDPNSFPFVPTGITQLDRKMLGLTLGDVTIISGLAGAGKTSLIDFIVLNAAQKGFKTAAWSGELQDFRFMSWLDQMAAGKTHVKPQPGYNNIYYAPKHIAEAINKWLDGKFWLYNNSYGNKWSQLLADINEIIDEKKPEIIVIDNLTALDLDMSRDDKLERQKSLIGEVKQMAKQKNIHVILVCHPRKEQSYHMLRMESISGSSDLVNLADNVLIVHRGGTDLQKRMQEFFDPVTADEYSRFDTVIEIAKNRSHGRVGELIGMFFEIETRRFKNLTEENIVYDWDTSVPKMVPDLSFLNEDDLPE